MVEYKPEKLTAAVRFRFLPKLKQTRGMWADAVGAADGVAIVQPTPDYLTGAYVVVLGRSH